MTAMIELDDALIKLNTELATQLSHYWHEIDFNGGRDASSYYTEDAEFHGNYASYIGVAKIQQFYDWRVAQGPRLSVHSFTNHRAWFTGPDTAEATNFLDALCAQRREDPAEPCADHGQPVHRQV